MSDVAGTAKLASIGVITTIFVVGAIYGRVHQARSDAKINAVGDRVVSGLLALPLISLLQFSLIPDAHKVWAILVPLPLAWYLVLLAGTDMKWKWCVGGFTKYLLIGTSFIYLLWYVAYVYI